MMFDILQFVNVALALVSVQYVMPCEVNFEQSACHVQSFGDNAGQITGHVTLTRMPCLWTTRVRVHVDISGLPADGQFTKHGFHVHQYGNLSNGCISTGGHFNPFNNLHGSPFNQPSARHVGDLGNVVKNTNGRIRADFFANEDLELHGRNSVVGRAIVLHAGEDDLGRGGDLGSQRTGNAGGRLACCVLEPLVQH